MPHTAFRQPTRRPPTRRPFPGRTIPGSSPAQHQPVRSTPSFFPVLRQPAGGRTLPGSTPGVRIPVSTARRPNPTIFSPGRQALLESQAKDRATLGIGSPGGLTRQGLSAKLVGVGQGTTRAKRASSPAVRDPFQVANEKRLKEGKPLSRAAVNAPGRR